MSKIKSTGEIVTGEELGARYAELLRRQNAEGYGAGEPEGHFNLALLYLATKQFKPADKYGLLYLVPKSSSFSAANLATKKKGLENK